MKYLGNLLRYVVIFFSLPVVWLISPGLSLSQNSSDSCGDLNAKIVVPDAVSNDLQLSLDDQNKLPIQLLHDPLGETIYLVNLRGIIQAFNQKNLELLWTSSELKLNSGEGFFQDAAISSDGKLLFLVGSDARISVLNVQKNEKVETKYVAPVFDDRPINAHFVKVSISPDEQYFVTADLNGMVYIWSISDSRPLFYKQFFDEPVKDLNFSRSGTFISAGATKDVKIYSLDRQEFVFSLEQKLNKETIWINSLYFPENEAYILAQTKSNTYIIEVESGEFVHEIFNECLSGKLENDADSNDFSHIYADRNMENIWAFSYFPFAALGFGTDTKTPTESYLSAGNLFSLILFSTQNPSIIGEFVVLSTDFNIFTGESKTVLKRIAFPL